MDRASQQLRVPRLSVLLMLVTLGACVGKVPMRQGGDTQGGGASDGALAQTSVDPIGQRGGGGDAGAVDGDGFALGSRDAIPDRRGDDRVTGHRDGAAADQRPDVPKLVDPCARVRCSGRGQCKVDAVNGTPYCACDKYYKAKGLRCVSVCDDVECGEGEVCIPGHHDLVDPLCVLTCDCSNCGNCAAAEIPSYGAVYCGTPEGPDGAISCNRPCPTGQGCIPFRTPICWPGQGCLSK